MRSPRESLWAEARRQSSLNTEKTISWESHQRAKKRTRRKERLGNQGGNKF